MSSLHPKVQRRQKRDARVKFFEDDLPPAEKPPPGDTTVLRGHGSSVDVIHVVAIPESGLIATASDSVTGVRIFALDGDGEPLHICSETWSVSWRALAALGADVLVYFSNLGNISTWRVSTGTRLMICRLSGIENTTVMAKLGPGKFVVGTSSGALVFLSHRDGRDLHKIGQGSVSHGSMITTIAVRGDAIVTTSAHKSAMVWSAARRERVAVLSGHSNWVRCAAVCERFIATGSYDNTIRLYKAGAGHDLVCVIEGLHSDWVQHVEFVGEDMLMSASDDQTVAFTSLSRAKPLARLNADFGILSASITPDARIACVGRNSNAAIFPPPAVVATAVKDHATSTFPPCQSLAFAKNEPLQAAMVEVLAGSRDAGDACRALVTEENCCRSIEEWASAHSLLMAAVRRAEIPGEQHFEGKLFYWFEKLYTPSRVLELGEDDWHRVKECADEAKRAGVISEPEAVLATVMSGQDLLKNVTKLQMSGQKIVSILWEVMKRQAERDIEIGKLIKKVNGIDRTQKLNAVFGCVFSFAPLGGNALAQGFVGVARVWSLLDSTMNAVVGIQGAVTPLVLDKFVGRAASMIAPAGWKILTADQQVVFKGAVEALDIPWEEFCGIIQKAAAQRGLEAANAIQDGAEEESASGGGADDPDSVTQFVGASDSDLKILSGDSCEELSRDERSETSAGPADGLAISDMTISDSGHDFSVLKAAARDVNALVSMNDEAFAEVVAAVMINFVEGLRPHYVDMRECLKNIFHRKAICGDLLVSYPEGKLYEDIVAALASEEKYSCLDAGARFNFEFRLQSFLSHFRIQD